MVPLGEFLIALHTSDITLQAEGFVAAIQEAQKSKSVEG